MRLIQSKKTQPTISPPEVVPPAEVTPNLLIDPTEHAAFFAKVMRRVC